MKSVYMISKFQSKVLCSEFTIIFPLTSVRGGTEQMRLNLAQGDSSFLKKKIQL